MVLAHFNKHELEELDKAQGGKDLVKGTDIRQYKRLGEAFKNPELKEITLHASRNGYATGGDISHMKHQGRHGDTEMALVPTELADHFDKMMGKKSINPHTGKREYFDFNSLATGLGNMFGGGSSAPAAGGAAAAPATGGATPSQGTSWGSLLGNLAGSFLQPKPAAAPAAPANPNNGAPTPQNPQSANPSWANAGMNGLMSGLGAIMQSRQNGGNWADALKSGAMAGGGQFAQQAPFASLFGGQGGAGGGYLGQFMSNPMVQAGMSGLGTAANSYMQGNGFQNALTQGLNQGLSGFNNPYANAAKTGLNAYQNGGNMMDAFGQAGLQGMGALADQHGYGSIGNAARGMLDARQNGNSWMNSGQQGALAGLSGFNNPYANAARGAINTNMNGGNLQDSLMNGGMNGLQSFMDQRNPQQQNMQQQNMQQQNMQKPNQNYSPPKPVPVPISTNTSRKRKKAFGGPINTFGPMYA